MRTLVIVPAFNEEKVLPAVIKDLGENFPEADVLVVNDGSTDGTSSVAREAGVGVVDLPYNLGIGGAMQAGFMYASREGYEAAVQFDGDGQHRADQIRGILKPLDGEDAGLVVGSRFLGSEGYKVPIPRLMGIKIFSTLLSLITGGRLTDATSGFRAYGRKAIEVFSRLYPDDYPEVEAIVILHNCKIRVQEVPVLMRERQGGSSSITPLASVYYMVKVLLSIMLSLGRRTGGLGGQTG